MMRPALGGSGQIADEALALFGAQALPGLEDVGGQSGNGVH
ncbi:MULTISPECIES: hypothetical protein [unclassified Achromobacter]|nr:MULTISPECIES: hypothetical protein [unclassified Achromobacter]